ncbi:MAG: hypothetical protein WBB29_03660, partial [Geitlerinemataceae cyanobacterium]
KTPVKTTELFSASGAVARRGNEKEDVGNKSQNIDVEMGIILMKRSYRSSGINAQNALLAYRNSGDIDQ